MADAKIYGVDVAGILTTARAQAQGGQKAAFNSGIAAAFGAAPRLQIKVGGVVKYEALMSAAMTGSASGVLPAALNAPTVNLADAVTDASAELVISNTAFSAGAIVGNLAMLGDSLTRGSLNNYFSPASHLKSLLAAGSYTATFVGSYLADPGSVPVDANGGWKIANLSSQITTLAALSPRTLIINIGTNDIGVTASVGAAMTTYLDDLATGIGGLTGKRVIVCIPNNLSWFDAASYTDLKSAITAWVAAGTNRYSLDLSTAGLVSADYWDVTHWLESGANKIASLMYGKLVSALNAESGVAAGSRRLVVPVNSAAVTGKLRLSPPLDGASTLALALSAMLPPPGLDAAVTTPPVSSDYTAIADRVINIMGTFNDDELAGITTSGSNPWWSRPILDMQNAGHSTHASVVMGAEPTYANAVQWVRDQMDSAFAAYKNDVWSKFLNWFVVCDGKANSGHRATNTGVRLSQYETWTRHQDTKVWTRRAKDAVSDGSYGYKPSLTGDAGAITWRNSGAYREMYVPDKSQLTDRGPHPYGNFVSLSDFGSFDCIAVGVKVGLIVWDPAKTDDRNIANLLFQIGGDFYPSTLTGKVPGWVPGFGGTKFAQITTTEQWFAAASLTNARKDYVSATGCAISAAEFRNNPPPFGS